MASKKKQDEKHLKMLREMVALPHNKQCFDCHQRGPTYVNMTIGSYVCTACSGLLRGLNPPHRVKSISMASFTTDEIEFIKCHGNEYCRKVWLGLYDNRVSLQTDGRDESKVKDFMTQKYERKRYYVAPTDSMKDEAKTMNESAITKVPGTKPLKSLLGENAPRIQVGNYQKASATPPPISSNPQSPGSTSIQSSKSSSGSTAMDLLGDLGGDPFASTTPQSTSSSGGGFADFGSFGNSAPAPSSQAPAFSQSAPLQPAGSGSQPLFNGFGSTPASTAPAQAVPAPAPGGGGDKYSNLSDLFSTTTEESSSSGWSSTMNTSSGGLNWGGGSQTSTSSSTGGINWGGDTNTSTGGLNWNSSSTQSAPSSTGLGWGGAPATAQSNGIGVPGNPFLSATVSNPFGGSSGTSLTSQTPGGMPGVSQSHNPNPFGGQPASSGGFGAFGQQPQQNVSQNAGFGQFGAPNVSSGAGFGQFGGTPASTASAGFGQFGGTPASTVSESFGQFGGTPASTASAGFGQFGGTPASTANAGFGQFGVQNGGFGANTPSPGFGGAQTTMASGFGAQQGFGAGQQSFGQPQQAGFGGAGFGGQPAQGFPQQQQQPAGFGGQPAQMQGFGGAQNWGQMPGGSSASANPFMSTAQQYSNTAPKTGATNPFL